jgi:hypothetical protein
MHRVEERKCVVCMYLRSRSSRAADASLVSQLGRKSGIIGIIIEIEIEIDVLA